MAIVNLVDVDKNYGQQAILQKINVLINDGEFVAVIGPSGCGKSTLLRLVAGLDTLSEGQILINEQCINTIPPAKRDMAMVFQSYALYPHMTVYENMAYGLKMRSIKTDIIRKRVTEAAEMLELSALLDRKPKALSGGQRQRVAMGRAIVRSPAVFLFDEPLSNLDTKLRTEMRHEIKRLHSQLNTTSLYVTHDQTEAMTMASRVVVLNQGKVEQIDSPQKLYDQPASLFVAGFTGHYPLNLIPVKFDTAHQVLITEAGNLFLPLPTLTSSLSANAKLLVGIRAEHLDLTADTAGKLPVKVLLVDHLGADKLVHAQSVCSTLKLSIRVPAEQPLTDMPMGVQLKLAKANLFDATTGLRLGGWDA